MHLEHKGKIVFVKLTNHRPGQVLRAPGGWKFPEFLDNVHMKVVRLSALCTGCLYPLGDIPSALS